MKSIVFPMHDCIKLMSNCSLNMPCCVKPYKIKVCSAYNLTYPTVGSAIYQLGPAAQPSVVVVYIDSDS